MEELDKQEQQSLVSERDQSKENYEKQLTSVNRMNDNDNKSQYQEEITQYQEEIELVCQQFNEKLIIIEQELQDPNTQRLNDGEKISEDSTIQTLTEPENIIINEYKNKEENQQEKPNQEELQLLLEQIDKTQREILNSQQQVEIEYQQLKDIDQQLQKNELELKKVADLIDDRNNFEDKKEQIQKRQGDLQTKIKQLEYSLDQKQQEKEEMQNQIIQKIYDEQCIRKSINYQTIIQAECDIKEKETEILQLYDQIDEITLEIKSFDTNILEEVNNLDRTNLEFYKSREKLKDKQFQIQEFQNQQTESLKSSITEVKQSNQLFDGFNNQNHDLQNDSNNQSVVIGIQDEQCQMNNLEGQRNSSNQDSILPEQKQNQIINDKWQLVDNQFFLEKCENSINYNMETQNYTNQQLTSLNIQLENEYLQYQKLSQDVTQQQNKLMLLEQNRNKLYMQKSEIQNDQLQKNENLIMLKQDYDKLIKQQQNFKQNYLKCLKDEVTILNRDIVQVISSQYVIKKQILNLQHQFERLNLDNKHLNETKEFVDKNIDVCLHLLKKLEITRIELVQKQCNIQKQIHFKIFEKFSLIDQLKNLQESQQLIESEKQQTYNNIKCLQESNHDQIRIKDIDLSSEQTNQRIDLEEKNINYEDDETIKNLQNQLGRVQLEELTSKDEKMSRNQEYQN